MGLQITILPDGKLEQNLRVVFTDHIAEQAIQQCCMIIYTMAGYRDASASLGLRPPTKHDRTKSVILDLFLLEGNTTPVEGPVRSHVCEINNIKISKSYGLL